MQAFLFPNHDEQMGFRRKQVGFVELSQLTGINDNIVNNLFFLDSHAINLYP